MTDKERILGGARKFNASLNLESQMMNKYEINKVYKKK